MEKETPSGRKRQDKEEGDEKEWGKTDDKNGSSLHSLILSSSFKEGDRKMYVSFLYCQEKAIKRRGKREDNAEWGKGENQTVRGIHGIFAFFEGKDRKRRT